MSYVSILLIKYLCAFFLAFLSILCMLTIIESRDRFRNFLLAVAYVLILVLMVRLDYKLIGPLVVSQLFAWLLLLLKIIFIPRKE